MDQQYVVLQVFLFDAMCTETVFLPGCHSSSQTLDYARAMINVSSTQFVAIYDTRPQNTHEGSYQFFFFKKNSARAGTSVK
jgi:hypothetical protein